jgi:trk system potassium uptake protein TrkA
VAREEQFLVIGLGRFGGALAETLAELGRDVLGVDLDEKLVQRYADQLTHVVQCDTTDPEAMAQIGAAEFRTAVVAIGTDMEASILTTALLSDLGVPRIVAKAITAAHGKILERVGAHRVIFPERDMGIRVGHTLTGRALDYFQLDPGFALV